MAEIGFEIISFQFDSVVVKLSNLTARDVESSRIKTPGSNWQYLDFRSKIIISLFTISCYKYTVRECISKLF